MSAIFFSTESLGPAAQMIMDCFQEIQRGMNVTSLEKYTDAIFEIAIIPCCVDEERIRIFNCKDSKYISWIRKEADIRLLIPFIPFIQASKDERLAMCKEIVKESLAVVHTRCMRKKLRFDLDALLSDVFPNG